MIKIANSEKSFKLTTNTQQDMDVFRELGNLSAHKIWYNSTNYRGKGIGKKMLSQVFEYAKNDNMKNIQILTDESCNFKFYEACDCKKLYEKVINNGEPSKCGNVTSEMGYIYEKIL